MKNIFKHYNTRNAKFSIVGITIFLLFFLICGTSETYSAKPKSAITKEKPAGKRNFTFSDAMKFELLRSPKLSNDGSWFGFDAKQDRGDATLHINSTSDTAKFLIPNGRGVTFSNDSKWAVATIGATELESENAKTPKDKPNNALKLINLQTREEFDSPNMQSYKFAEDSRWLAYQIKINDKPKMEKYKDKSLGSLLKLRHLNSGTEISIDWVSEYLFDTNAVYLFYTISSPDGKQDGVYARELQKEFAPEKKIQSAENCNFSNIAWNEKQALLAYLFTTLTDKGKPKDCTLLIANMALEITPLNNNSNANSKAEVKIDTIVSDSTYPKDWYIPNTNRLVWNETKQLLYFGFKPVAERYDEDKEPIKFKDSTLYNVDTLLAKSEVYVWHWNDPFIMTHQQTHWKHEKDRTYSAVYNTNNKNYIQLADTTVIDVAVSKNDNYALAFSDKLYRKEQTWYGDCENVYIIDLSNGAKTRIAEKLEENSFISNSGNYAAFFKGNDWFLYDTKQNTTINLTQKLPTSFNDIFLDVPSNPQSNGFGGWIDDDNGLFLYDNWDVWYFDLRARNGKANEFVLDNGSVAIDEGIFAKCLTRGKGKAANTKYTIHRVNSIVDYHSVADTLLVMAFNKTTKDAGIFAINPMKNGKWNDGALDERIPMAPQFFRDCRKAKDNNKIYFTKETYTEFPNYYLTDFAFNSPKQISALNLHILDTFNWGHTQLVNWKYKDTTLPGYLVLPDNYDSSKKYPVVVYFYDQMSDRMNRFYMPELTHRPVNQVFMDNYIMFFPDIKYGVGSPGIDALECILSGCRYLAEKGIIDTNKSCIQGHSWGGYQTAYIATQPTFFSAACAGAPVGNMTSAYSGIRLGSGRARQMQYEAQQSRIGGNIFDSLDAYIRNSPIFFANKATTPLLIGHGDVDEAVPYQQGVELYMAFRRAEKNAILLQYVNEPHWVGRYWNKVDYSIKMKEFFDHYCIGTPAPEWMLRGKQYKGEKY